MFNSGKSLLIPISYFLLGILVLYPACHIGFLGDFAGDLLNCRDNWFHFAAYQWNFYVPAMAIYYVLYKTFHLFPLPYQVFHLSLIFLNAWLVYLLAQELKFAPWQCWLAGLLALFNSTAFETYFWLSTTPKVLATSCGLIALIFLCRFRQRKAVIWGWGYVMMVTLGLTMESTGLILPLLGLLLDHYYRPWAGTDRQKPSPLAGVRLHLWTLGLAGIFLLSRHLLGIKPYVENASLIRKSLTFIRSAVSIFFHGLENKLGSESLGVTLVSIILIMLLSVILILAVKNKSVADKRRFITLLLLWGGACLPHALGANYLSRYLYFPAVFGALMAADLLGSFQVRLYTRDCTWLAILMIIAGYLYLDFSMLHQTMDYYLEGSRLYAAGIQKIETSLPEMPPNARLVLVDFPSCIYRPRRSFPGGQFRPGILIYQNALPHHLLLIYQEINFSVTLLRLSPLDSRNADNPRPLGTLTTPEQLAALSTLPRTFILRYLPGHRGNFVIVHDTLTPAYPLRR